MMPPLLQLLAVPGTVLPLPRTCQGRREKREWESSHREERFANPVHFGGSIHDVERKVLLDKLSVQYKMRRNVANKGLVR